MALMWPLFSWSTWAQPTNGVAGTPGECAALAFVRLVGVAQPATVVAGRTGEVAALGSFRSVGMGSASHCGGGDDISGRCSVLFSLCRRGLSQPRWWLTRQVRALLWPLFAQSAWAQAATWWFARQVRALLWPLFDRSAWAQPATELAGTTVEGAALDSIRSFGVGSASDCGGGHDWFGHCSGLCSLVRRGLSHPLWWRARLMSAFLWPLFAWSAGAQTLVNLCLIQPLRWRARQMMVLAWSLFAWSPCAQPNTVVGGMTDEGASRASVRYVVLGSASHTASLLASEMVAWRLMSVTQGVLTLLDTAAFVFFFFCS
jgi:hypothetical protein